LTCAAARGYLGADMNLRLEEEIRNAYPEGLTWQKGVATFHPESAAQAADVFRRAAAYHQHLFISGFANNVDPVGEPFADILVIKTDRLNSMIEIAEKDYYLTVGAGYPMKEIDRAVGPYGLWHPFSGTNYPGSVGGALASGLTGDDGAHPVPFSRYLLAVTAVLPDGSIVTPGAVTFKSVSGYDISRIFYNSWGTLGLVVQLTLRVLPASKRGEWPHVTVSSPDRNRFIRDLQGDTPLARLCRRIKSEYDPGGLLPII
jgi:FAD/FMN-containing dehydrogenase